jgi:hypothetical protein
MIVTGQAEKPPELEGLRTVAVKQPSVELKRRIAESVGILSATGVEVLKAINSGIEAEIVGRIGQDLNADAIRLVLLARSGRAGQGLRPGRDNRPRSQQSRTDWCQSPLRPTRRLSSR